MSSLPPPPARLPAGPPVVPPLPTSPPPPPGRGDRQGPGRSRGWNLTGLIAALAIFAGGAGTAWLAFGRGDDGDRDADIVVPTTAAPRPTTPLSSAEIDPAVNEAGTADPHGSIDVNAVATAVAPSVVTISADVDGGFQAGEAVGTGVIVSEDGEIITNAHVVAGATEIRVRLAGNTEPIVAELVAADPGNDLALLRIDVDKPLPAATFANPDDILLGDHVVAIGFALDLDGDPSVTLGIISALDRTLSESTQDALDGLIQTDAAISSGNSGGPLVNAAGQVVGINTAVARSDAEIAASNVGFAISSGEVLQVLEQLRTGSERQEGRLGVGVAPRNDGGQGAIVTFVDGGLPAADAGIQVGDIIVQVDESMVTGSAALVAAVRDHSPGDEVSIVVLRDGEPVPLTVTLAGR